MYLDTSRQSRIGAEGENIDSSRNLKTRQSEIKSKVKSSIKSMSGLNQNPQNEKLNASSLNSKLNHIQIQTSTHINKFNKKNKLNKPCIQQSRMRQMKQVVGCIVEQCRLFLQKVRNRLKKIHKNTFRKHRTPTDG